MVSVCDIFGEGAILALHFGCFFLFLFFCVELTMSDRPLGRMRRRKCVSFGGNKFAPAVFKLFFSGSISCVQSSRVEKPSLGCA